MKKVYERIISIIFVGFISITLLFSLLFNWHTMLESLYENKDKILNVRLSSEYVKDVIDSIDSAYTEGVFFRKQYIDIYGGLQKMSGKSIIWDSNPNNTIMIGSDGKLYSSGNITMNFADYYSNKDILNKYAEAVSDLSMFTTQNDVDLLFFQAPARYDADEISLPIKISDTSKDNVDYLYSQLKDNTDLTVLNSQILYKEQDIDFADLFFKTDHHWNIKTAFWAYSEICKALNNYYDYKIPELYFNIDNYINYVIPSSYLGSLGVRTGGLFAGRDDFDLIYPKFETDYVKTICKVDNLDISRGGGIQYKGKFEEVILSDVNKLKSKKSEIIFGSYVSSDRSEVIIENRKSATDKKVLILKDSFALPVSAFLSTCFAETRLLDLRYQHEKSVKEYILDYAPDAVLIIYNPGAYSDTFFNFDKKN
ncbi:MAG: hypothetical protein J5911_04140 [Clostridia bacterium]|nr:hypothetical protein [Clostridia bacterium]MBO4518219.1 hypothetical protein [Clostridia bacterium]